MLFKDLASKIYYINNELRYLFKEKDIQYVRNKVTDDWMQTYSCINLWLLNPKPENFCIEDISHALSLDCRFSKQCRVFYSTAQHSYYVAEKAEDNYKLDALLHDRIECYIVDLITPLKTMLPDYVIIEKHMELVSAEVFGISPVMPKEIHFIDKKIMITEASQ